MEPNVSRQYDNTWIYEASAKPSNDSKRKRKIVSKYKLQKFLALLIEEHLTLGQYHNLLDRIGRPETLSSRAEQMADEDVETYFTVEEYS